MSAAPGSPAEPVSAASRAADEVARASYGRLVAYLASRSGDIAAAEDALGDALLAALQTWPVRGVPDRPEAWLLVAARRRLIGSARRREVAARALPNLARLAPESAEPSMEPGGPDEPGADLPGDGPVPDRRLELLFVCAHPAIDEHARSPLMLQTVLGLDAARIAAAFLVAPTTMGQRLVRAKARIKAQAVPFAEPAPDERRDRLGSVLDAIYAAYGTGWEDPSGGDVKRDGLTAEAIRLARLTAELLPEEAEAHGLVALLLHSDARARARRDPEGRFVALTDQDVSLWSRRQMAQAETHLAQALARRDIGPYQLQAAIQSVHNRRALTGHTDWAAIAALYDGLVEMAPTVGAAVARASAHAEVAGPSAGLALLEALPDERIAAYQPYWVLRAHLLGLVGSAEEADRAAAHAIDLTEDPAVRRHLLTRHLLTRQGGGLPCAGSPTGRS